MRLFKAGLILLCLSLKTLAFASIAETFETIKQDQNALYAFLKEMPKGGELHYHLAGGAYPEAMLQVAASHSDYCIDAKTFVLSEVKQTCSSVSAANIFKGGKIYDQVIRAWSMKDFVPGRQSGHDHFFSTFYKFLPIVSYDSSFLLADTLQRAADQNELYLEIMVMPDDARSAVATLLPPLRENYQPIMQKLLEDKDFKARVKQTVHSTSQLIPAAHQIMSCKSKPSNACKLVVKFQYYILREQPLSNFFSQALHGFEVASRSNDVVGINLVQAEDGIISLRDYKAQMTILNFLHAQYPNVHIALHAGELTNELVTPQELSFHIHDAIKIAHAERIGHGVDIAHETNANALLDFMAQHRIAVEINLTSNKKILNIAGKRHPLNFYLQHHVPVVLSTDDEGILRTNLTEQYLDAVINHHLDYKTIKQINRNALTYSFLSGQSLWQRNGFPVDACKEINSQSCLNFVANNEKAGLQRMLELNLKIFEANYLR